MFSSLDQAKLQLCLSLVKRFGSDELAVWLLDQFQIKQKIIDETLRELQLRNKFDQESG